MLTIALIDFERKYRDTIRKLWPILTQLHTLRIEKEFDDQQIQETINKMELPLRYHLFITGHFTKLMDVVESRGGGEMNEAKETTEQALKSARDALWAIANMQIIESTNKSEVLALCVSIAKIELEKINVE